jgi:uncharacterized protein YprB with RNaseH-like and TPR domain
VITKSFIFLGRIGNHLERNIWQQGITNWDSFLKSKKIKGISNKRKGYYNRQLLKAQSALYNFNSQFFFNTLPQAETWRLYDFFKDECIFLDIETSGMSIYDDITVIGLFDGLNTKTMIKGINLDYNFLKNELKKYKLIVTFNGATFDIPFIKKRYPNLLPEVPNFDLRVACQRVGLTGGLKEIEKKINIQRSKIVDGMYGGDALLLWKMFRASGDDYYLKLLVEYNEEDVFNLKKIADYVYDKLKWQTLKK